MTTEPTDGAGRDESAGDTSSVRHEEIMNYLMASEKHLRSIKSGINFFVILATIALILWLAAAILGPLVG